MKTRRIMPTVTLHDIENDADSDTLCGDGDSCRHGAENDVDSDLGCAHKNGCVYDAANDSDSDSILRRF